jgi:hypothetical protein
MPNRDGSGPRGDGRMGRGLGNCKPSTKAGITNSKPGNTRYNLVEIGADLLVSAIYKLLSHKSSDERR